MTETRTNLQIEWLIFLFFNLKMCSYTTNNKTIEVTYEFAYYKLIIFLSNNWKLDYRKSNLVSSNVYKFHLITGSQWNETLVHPWRIQIDKKLSFSHSYSCKLALFLIQCVQCAPVFRGCDSQFFIGTPEN